MDETTTTTDPGADALALILQLEKRLQRLRAAFMVLALVVASALALSIYVARPGSQRVLTGGELALRDAAGNLRVRIDAEHQNSGAPTFVIYDPEGRKQALLVAGDTGPGLTFYGTQGEPRLWAGLIADAPSVELIGDSGSPQAHLALVAGKPRLTLFDESGRERPVPVVMTKRVAPRSRMRSRLAPVHAWTSGCQPGTLGCGERYAEIVGPTSD